MNTDMPLVSVIIPTYNRAHLVGRAIRSVLNQTYQDFELIVVDDGSSDNTEEVVKGFNDDRIRYIRHDENKGGAAARNTGIKAARGDYIAFQDSDDVWLQQKLAKQMLAIERSPSLFGVVYTGFWRIKDNHREYMPSNDMRPRSGEIHKDLLERNFIGFPSVLVKRECFEKVGLLDEQLPRLQDWELWIRISKYYYFYYIDEPLFNSYVLANSISSDEKALLIAHELILEKHLEDIQKYRRILAKHSYSLGNFLCQNGEMTEGKAYLTRAMKAYPFNAKLLLAVFASLFGQSNYNKLVGLKRRIIPVK